MRIATLTIGSVLMLGSALVMAHTPAQQVHQYNRDIHQLNKDIRANAADRKKDRQVYGDQRADLSRDRLDRNADQKRENADLAKGDYKQASYWNKQRIDESSEIGLEKKDLAHTRQDLKNDNGRLTKDERVRRQDIAKRNKAASQI